MKKSKYRATIMIEETSWRTIQQTAARMGVSASALISMVTVGYCEQFNALVQNLLSGKPEEIAAFLDALDNMKNGGK